jgi:hypothetical protein
MKGRKHVYVAALGLVFGSGLPHEARAGEEMAEPAMVRLLRTDAIVFATVTSVNPVTDDGLLVNVQLGDAVAVKSRWDLDAQPLTLLRVQGTLGLDEGGKRFVKVGHAGTLREQSRYLLLLSGGEWRVAPLTRGGDSIFELRGDGIVGCGSGAVYGIDDYGFVCSHVEDQAGPPLGENSLGELILRRLARAIRQRPQLEAQFAKASQPLRLEPEAR